MQWRCKDEKRHPSLLWNFVYHVSFHFYSSQSVVFVSTFVLSAHFGWWGGNHVTRNLSGFSVAISRQNRINFSILSRADKTGCQLASFSPESTKMKLKKHVIQFRIHPTRVSSLSSMISGTQVGPRDSEIQDKMWKNLFIHLYRRWFLYKNRTGTPLLHNFAFRRQFMFFCSHFSFPFLFPFPFSIFNSQVTGLL